MTNNQEKKNELQKTDKQLQLAHSEKFTNKILAEFGNVAGEIQVSEYQRKLIQGYFVGIDRALKTAEENRLRKNEKNTNHKYDNNIPITWQNVNLNDLAQDLYYYARIGLDMMQDNHLTPIPYKNNKTQKYDMTLMKGYNGIRYIAEKYALENPKAVTTELVYNTDTFKPIKKNINNNIEGYEFEINNPFDRGDIVGGFGYIEYEDRTKNKLIIMTLKDIMKRRPEYAAAEFWGGKKKVWQNGKQVEVETDGWYEEMCLKTIKREVYSAKHIPRDPYKIDEEYQQMRLSEARHAAIEVQNEIDANANMTVIDTTPNEPKQLPQETIDYRTGEITAAPAAPGQQTMVDLTGTTGPNF